jgi:hypothetical protein
MKRTRTAPKAPPQPPKRPKHVVARPPPEPIGPSGRTADEEAFQRWMDDLDPETLTPPPPDDESD